jgi:hypothetical protein
MLLMQQVLLLVTIFPWIAYLCFAQTTSASDQSNASDLTSTISNEIKTHTITVGKVVENSIFAIRKGEIS